MEEGKNIYGVVIAIAIVGLLLSCVAGAVAGGVVGLVVGRNQARIAAERALEGVMPGRMLRQMPWLLEPTPLPIPEPEDDSPPLDMPPMGMRGALITAVLSGTPAEEAGLQVGDILIAVDRTPVDATHQLADVLAQYQPGDRATLTVWRTGQEETIRVTLGEDADVSGKPYLGIRYRMMGPSFNAPGS